MRLFIKKAIDFIQEEDGVTAIEYALIASLIAVFIIGAISVTGGSLDSIYISVSNDIDAVAGRL